MELSAEEYATVKRKHDQVKKRLEMFRSQVEFLWNNYTEKEKILRTISESLAILDEQKKNPSDLVKQNIAKVIKKYDQEITPKLDDITASTKNHIHQSLDELNNILNTFNFIAAYVVTCDTKHDNKTEVRE